MNVKRVTVLAISGTIAVMLICLVLLVQNRSMDSAQQDQLVSVVVEPDTSQVSNDDATMLTNPDGSRSSYSVKDGRVFFASQLIQDADPESFRAIGTFYAPSGTDSYGADAYRVYLWDSSIEGADPASFMILGTWQNCEYTISETYESCQYNAEDKKHRYAQDRIVERKRSVDVISH
jgi:hypothetical protein